MFVQLTSVYTPGDATGPQHIYVNPAFVMALSETKVNGKRATVIKLTTSYETVAESVEKVLEYFDYGTPLQPV